MSTLESVFNSSFVQWLLSLLDWFAPDSLVLKAIPLAVAILVAGLLAWRHRSLWTPILVGLATFTLSSFTLFIYILLQVTRPEGNPWLEGFNPVGSIPDLGSAPEVDSSTPIVGMLAPLVGGYNDLVAFANSVGDVGPEAFNFLVAVWYMREPLLTYLVWGAVGLALLVVTLIIYLLADRRAKKRATDELNASLVGEIKDLNSKFDNLSEQSDRQTEQIDKLMLENKDLSNRFYYTEGRGAVGHSALNCIPYDKRVDYTPRNADNVYLAELEKWQNRKEEKQSGHTQPSAQR